MNRKEKTVVDSSGRRGQGSGRLERRQQSQRPQHFPARSDMWMLGAFFLFDMCLMPTPDQKRLPRRVCSKTELGAYQRCASTVVPEISIHNPNSERGIPNKVTRNVGMDEQNGQGTGHGESANRV